MLQKKKKKSTENYLNDKKKYTRPGDKVYSDNILKCIRCMIKTRIYWEKKFEFTDTRMSIFIVTVDECFIFDKLLRIIFI